MFTVGQKVVCVDASKRRGTYGWHPGSSPTEGAVYVVRAVGPCFDGAPGIKLIELELNGWWDGMFFRDEHYDTTRFRPVVERKTDIGFAHEILRKASKKQPLKVS